MSEVKEDRTTTHQVDRQKMTPFLLRIFINDGKHFGISEYTNEKIPPKHSQLQVYTWLDANLGEITSLIREVDKFQDPNLQFDYNVVYPDNHGKTYRMRNLGLTKAGEERPDDEITLAKSKYQIGDYLDVAILQPDADVAQINNHLNKASRPKIRGLDRGPRNRNR